MAGFLKESKTSWGALWNAIGVEDMEIDPQLSWSSKIREILFSGVCARAGMCMCACV